MEWTVVHFIEENMIEAVPVVWLHDNLCYWPPYSGKRLNRAIATCEKPMIDCWQLFKMRKLGKGRNYDNVLKAKAKASVAEDTSDLTSDYERKRIPKRKRYLYETSELSNESSSDDDADDGDNDRILPIKFPVPNCTSDDNVNPKPSISKAIGIQEKVFDKENITITSNNNQNNKLNENTFMVCSNLDVTDNRDKIYDKDIAFKKQVLRQLQVINLKQTQIWEDVQTILTTISRTQDNNTLTINNEESIFNKFVFPLQSISELNAVEDYLENEKNTNLFVKELTKIGGTTYKHTIKRIMGLVFSNKVAENYSWIGFKGKEKFSLLHISASIITAVQKTHSAITLCDIETAIKMWLVKAKSRNANKT